MDAQVVDDSSHGPAATPPQCDVQVGRPMYYVCFSISAAAVGWSDVVIHDKILHQEEGARRSWSVAYDHFLCLNYEEPPTLQTFLPLPKERFREKV